MVTEVTATDYTIRGVSLGGVYTSLQVPQLNVVFDIGLAPKSACSADFLCLSHAHADHIGSLITLLGVRALFDIATPLTIFLPDEMKQPLAEALAALGRLQREPWPVKLIGVQPGDVHALKGNLSLRVFRTYHTVPSCGYLLFRKVNKLKPEFMQAAPEEIGRLRKSGAPIFNEHEHHELAYATDTTIDVLDHEPCLLRAKVLIMECTFVDEHKSIEGARRCGHIHLDEIVDRASAFENQSLVLMHFSQTQSPQSVLRILSQRCPEKLQQRLIPFLPQEGLWWG